MKRHTHLLCRGMTTTKRMAARLVLLILLALNFSACAPGMPAASLTPIAIATVPTEINALLYIAEGQNFFASNCLQVVRSDAVNIVR